MIRGVVLCGGKSQRMGSDKGLLPWGAANWAGFALRKLEQLDLSACLSINSGQLPAYSCFFSSEQLITDETRAKGPLNGLLSVHLKYPDDDLLLLACDMKEMDVLTLSTLKNSAISFPGFDYYVYVEDEHIEPLCAIYTSASLKKLCLKLENGKLSGFSMSKIIKEDNYKALKMWNPQSFNNYNTATI